MSSTPAEGRNEYVFHRARTMREGTVEGNVRALNDSLPHPMKESEVRSITRSIERGRAKHGTPRAGGATMSAQERQQQRIRGAKGGSVHSDAQKAARAKATPAASAVRTAEAVGRAAMIVHWHEQGLTRRQIMAKTGLSEATVKRALRAHRDASD